MPPGSQTGKKTVTPLKPALKCPYRELVDMKMPVGELVDRKSTERLISLSTAPTAMTPDHPNCTT